MFYEWIRLYDSLNLESDKKIYLLKLLKSLYIILNPNGKKLTSIGPSDKK